MSENGSDISSSLEKESKLETDSDFDPDSDFESEIPFGGSAIEESPVKAEQPVETETLELEPSVEGKTASTLFSFCVLILVLPYLFFHFCFSFFDVFFHFLSLLLKGEQEHVD